MGEDHGKGFLLRNEFILAMHLIKKAKLGYPIPDKLPSNMEHFLAEYKEVMMTTSTGFDSVGLANSKLPFRKSSFENSGIDSPNLSNNSGVLNFSTTNTQPGYVSPLKNIAGRNRLAS